MYNYDDMKRNYEIIKEFSKVYRKELIATQAYIVSETGLADAESYIKFMNQLPESEFIGNQLTGILTDTPIELFEKVLNGELNFQDVMDITMDELKPLFECLNY